MNDIDNQIDTLLSTSMQRLGNGNVKDAVTHLVSAIRLMHEQLGGKMNAPTPEQETELASIMGELDALSKQAHANADALLGSFDDAPAPAVWVPTTGSVDGVNYQIAPEAMVAMADIGIDAEDETRNGIKAGMADDVDAQSLESLGIILDDGEEPESDIEPGSEFAHQPVPSDEDNGAAEPEAEPAAEPQAAIAEPAEEAVAEGEDKPAPKRGGRATKGGK